MSYQIGSAESIQLDAAITIHTIVTSGATTLALNTATFTPENGEKGQLDISWEAIGDAEGNGKVVRRIVVYKKSSTGVVTIGSKTVGFSPTPDSGYNSSSLDFDVVAGSNGTIQFNVTGIAGKDIRHVMQVSKNAGTLNV